MNQVYRVLKIRIPWRLVEERPDVLDLAARMRLAAEEFARKLSKKIVGKERVGLAPEELDRLLTPERRELALKMAEEVLAKYGLADCGLFLRYAPSFKAFPLGVGEKGPVVVDLEGGTVEIRWPGSQPFVIKLKRSKAKWIKKQLERGELKFAFLGIERRRDEEGPTYGGLYVGLVLACEVQRVEPRALVVVNNLGHYVKVGLVADGRAVETQKLPKEVRRLSQKLERISADIKRLEEALSRVDEDENPHRAEKLQKGLSSLERGRDKLIHKIVGDVTYRIVKLARERRAAVVVNVEEDIVSPRNLAERLLFEGLRGLRARLRRLAQLHGLPYLEERLPSTLCPICGAGMEEVGRAMRCPACGFAADRDDIPTAWAEKRYWEILQKAKQ